MREPKYRKQNRSGPGHDRAFVVIDGRRIYLGPHGSSESRERYHRVLAEHAAGVRSSTHHGSTEDSKSNCGMIVDELINLFLNQLDKRHAEGRLAKPINYRQVLKMLHQLYGVMQVGEFGPKHLVTIREKMVENGLRTRTVNERLAQLRAMFAWALEREYVRPEQSHALAQVRNATPSVHERPRDRIPPTPEEILAIQQLVSQQVWAMIQIQLLTGARPGEIVQMRAMDIDMNGEVWMYMPKHHKSQRRGKQRRIPLNIEAQGVLKPFISNRAIGTPLFSPQESVSEVIGVVKVGKRVPGEQYTTASYGYAIRRACKRVKTRVWSPHLLRHDAATRIEAKLGVEAAAAVCGHSSERITERYIHRNDHRAIEAVKSHELPWKAG